MGGYEEALGAFRSGDNQRARELSAEAFAVAQRDGDQAEQVDALCMLARVALRENDFARVRELADDARARARAARDQRSERMPLHMQAVAARMLGNLAEARRLYEDSIELNRSLGEEPMVAAEFHNLAYVELRDGRLGRAQELFKQARYEAKRIGYNALNPYLVGDLAVLAAVNGESRTAADATEQQRLRDELARELSADALRSLYAEGANLTPEAILEDPTYSR